MAIPVETAAGEVAQVDFGYAGMLYDPDEGRMRKAWVFVLVLAFSRLMVVRIVCDQTIETWLRCHAEAFAELGGVPKVLVPDNLNFFAARKELLDGVEVRVELRRWHDQIANARVHGTTRRRPVERFELERTHLLPLPSRRWEPVLWREAKVHTDTHVQVARAMYSVPWRLVGKSVLVRLTGHSVEDEAIVAGPRVRARLQWGRGLEAEQPDAA